jgi:hypothetical protein
VGLATNRPRDRAPADACGAVYAPAVNTRRRIHPLVLLSLFAAVTLVVAPTAASAKPKLHRVDLTGATKTVNGSIIASPAIQQGTVSGTPFGTGTIELTVKLDLVYRTATGTFRIRNNKGTVMGTLDGTIVGLNREIDFDGTADFTGGTGRYKRISGTGLEAHAHWTLDSPNGTLSLKGFATY